LKQKLKTEINELTSTVEWMQARLNIESGYEMMMALHAKLEDSNEILFEEIIRLRRPDLQIKL